MTITRFALMPDSVSLRDAMDRFGTLAVPVDLWETADAYHLRADLPGVTPDELEINATGDSITISGEVKRHPSYRDRSGEGGGHVRERGSEARPAEGRKHQGTDDQGQRSEREL